MNRLTERAPAAVEIDGITYPINTNYVDCIKTMLALQDGNLTHAERVDILLYNMYETTPHNALEAVKMALWFLHCGRDNEDKNIEKLCDMAQDSEYIYNAMLKKGVDLDTAGPLHWWNFMAHFAEIPESSFTRIVYLRSQNNKGKLTKEERAECVRIGWEVINFRDPEFEAEKEIFEEYLNGE